MTGPFDLAELLKGHDAFVVPRALCLGPPQAKHLSGGAGFGFAIAAMERLTGQPLISATASFTGGLQEGDRAKINAQITKAGRNIQFASAQIESDDLARVSAAGSFGAADTTPSVQWRWKPDAPPPLECEPLKFVRADPGDLHTHLDVRLALRPGDGRLQLWIRPNCRITSSVLAAIGDYVPEALHWNLGRRVGATSLDNAIRIFGLAPCEWLFCQTQLTAVANGRFHGEMTIFAEDGSLRALAAQSGLVREISN
jgi:acyl-CoA thioesterase II